MAVFAVAFISLLSLAIGATHTIGFNNAPVWTVGIGVSYPDVSITLGKTISFTSSNAHDVVLLTPPSSGSPWDLCTMTGIAASSRTTVFATSDFATSNSEKHYTPPTCGEYFLACSVSAHCAYGQRMKVTVTNVDGSACSSPCSGSACITTASKQAVTGSQNVHAAAPALPAMYWGVAFYDDLTVNIGDTVVFKTGAGFHDVAIAPDSTAYSSCTTSSKVSLAEWDGSGNISSACVSSSACCAGNACGKDGMYATYTYKAETAGEVYFICSIGGGSHCQQGQKFKLIVNSSPTTHTVGFNTAPVWTVGTGVSYPDMTITLGKSLSFTSSNTHDVVLLTPPSSGTPWDVCTMTGIATGSRTTVFATSDFAASNSEKHYTPPTCGDYYLACSVSAHCAFGQRMKVTVSNVDGSACASPCVGIACITAASKQTVSTSQNVHAVSPTLPAQYWGVAFYNDMTVNIGDSVIFKTGAGYHDVATAPDATAFATCSTSTKVVLAVWDTSGNISSTCVSNSACCTGNSCAKDGMSATYTYKASAAGEVYFICSIGGGMHCQQGQKFKLTVKATPSSTTLAGMSTTTQDASGATTPVNGAATTAAVASTSARVVAAMRLSFAPMIFAFGFLA